ncbi:MAG: ATP-binding protein [Acidobacteriota bacterium]|nr:ATP-binding protein [Acidobacteriota bacterium]
MLSLRARVFVGALLWSAGMFLGAGLLLTHYMLFAPQAAGNFHSFFFHFMWPIAIATVACLVVGLSQVRRGLASFDELRARLVDVREGRHNRLEGDYPVEVQPLVSDLNGLLSDREQRVARALTKAGDLAHGLKTPLAVLNQEAERAKAAGHTEVAAAITRQVDRMRRQVDYHLAQARASASGGNPGVRCHVLASADGLARTMHTLYAERGVRVDVEVSHEHYVQGQREDLDEMLGNLVDNACKWARSRVTISSSLEPGRLSRRSAEGAKADIVMFVDDDGPGLDPSLREAVLRRGVRADEAAPGSGLGLAIVRDLAELYGGSISLHESPAGGVRARLELPAA